MAKPMFKIGDKVKIASDNDNENYDKFRGKILTVSHVATSEKQHRGYDSGMEGMALYDFNGVPFSLYEYEIEPKYAKGSTVKGGFKLGDKVKVVRGANKGEKGVVSNTDSDFFGDYTIDVRGHKLSGFKADDLIKYAKGSTVKGGGVGDTIADRYARLTKTEAKRLDELSKKVRINEQTDEEDIEWDKLVHKYRGWDYGKFAKGTTIGKEKVWQVVYYGEKHLKQRGSSKGSYKTWVVATSREEAIQKVKSDDDEFAELKSAKPTTLDVERHKFGNGGALEGWGGTSESSQDGMLIGGTNAELTSNQYGKGGGVKRTKTAEEIYEEEQQNAMFNSEYAKGGVIPYALRKRVENVKKKFGIEITKEMGLQAYHWNTKDGMGGSGVGWEIFGQKFSIREVSRFNKRDSQTVGDTAIVLGEYYSKYGNGGMTSGWCYSIGGL